MLIDTDIIPDKVFLVCVEYYDGCTFSSESGIFHIAGAFADFNNATKMAKEIKEGVFQGHKPWDSYFAGLESVYVLGELVDSPSRIDF